jgi:hypothetical protein
MPNERHYQQLLLRTIHEDRTFVDGGAHIGLLNGPREPSRAPNSRV